MARTTVRDRTLFGFSLISLLINTIMTFTLTPLLQSFRLNVIACDLLTVTPCVRLLQSRLTRQPSPCLSRASSVSRHRLRHRHYGARGHARLVRLKRAQRIHRSPSPHIHRSRPCMIISSCSMPTSKGYQPTCATGATYTEAKATAVAVALAVDETARGKIVYGIF